MYRTFDGSCYVMHYYFVVVFLAAVMRKRNNIVYSSPSRVMPIDMCRFNVAKPK